ncbi:hypothetical protein E1B28_002510 [Marasmius oreades]|uniref:Enoyl reductase (ER) domain-containing protein n=1 Tax=Marasmius oreades TaxID=181124 RepID=A0A9P7RN70_9AGAR|nr:uncharacterized protein E1B28_002510 [Marasmius oreades]KAG7086562.1 hypothetical protein E1B28_002510 [Marasmius oreades]
MSFPKTTREYYYTKIGSYENLKSREAPLQPPKSFEVLVKTHAVSLQFRDLMVSNGKYPAQLPSELVPCSDMAGEIVAVGEDVKGWKKGDRVCANFAADHVHGDPTPEIQATGHGASAHGVLTQYKVFRPHSLVRIPDHLSFEEASTLPCAALTAYNALWGPVPLKPGDIVLVQGTGGVSIFALQFAVASGAVVIATSSSDEKLKIAQKLGAKHLINYKKKPEWDKEVLGITKGRGVDHVVEVGGAGTLEKSLNAVRYGGWIHTIGFVAGPGNGQDNVILQSIFKALTIRGIQIGSVAQFEAMNRMITANPNVTRPVIDKVFPFEEAVKAYAHLESQAHVGKVVIKVD